MPTPPPVPLKRDDPRELTDVAATVFGALLIAGKTPAEATPLAWQYAAQLLAARP